MTFLLEPLPSRVHSSNWEPWRLSTVLACVNEDCIMFVSLLQDGITKTGGVHVERFSYFTVCLRVLKYIIAMHLFSNMVGLQ